MVGKFLTDQICASNGTVNPFCYVTEVVVVYQKVVGFVHYPGAMQKLDLPCLKHIFDTSGLY